MTAAGATQVDVAVVGAGVSGVYCAWRLAMSDEYRDAYIAVYELSDRVGGRLVSVEPPGMPNVSVELGGMRFFSSQRNVYGLVTRELRLPIVELPADEPENVGFFRGERYRRWQFEPPVQSTGTGTFPYRVAGGYQAPAGFPFNADWEEREIAPTDLLLYAVTVAVPEYNPADDAATREATLRAATFDGRPLGEWGFWNLLARVLSREAYELMKAVVGYDSTFLNWNAVDSILLNLDFDPAVKKYRVVTGYDQVPLQLAERFRDTGGTVNFGHRLRQFDMRANGEGADKVVATFDTDDDAGRHRAVVVEADRLILAMPRTSLEGIRQVGPVLGRDQTHVHELLRTVKPDPLFKIAITYAVPWWQAYGVTEGRSLSDQPIRQCYYWGVEGQEPSGNPENHNGVLLLYNDAESMDFFGGYMNSTDYFEQRPNQWAGSGANGSPSWHRHPAPRRMVEAVHRQVVEMHDAKGVLEPYSAAAIDWSGYPYGGGVNFWKAGVNSDAVIPEVAQPKADLPIYIVGEAYSRSQSWVEGALETSELVLQTKFGLAPPPWVETADG